MKNPLQSLTFCLLTAAWINSPMFANVPTPEVSVPESASTKHLNEFSWYNEAPERLAIDSRLKHQSFFSQRNQTDVGYYLYLPEDYYKSTESGRRYPTIYMLHGGRPGAEYKGTGMFPFFQKGMADGFIPQCIYVIVNGGHLSHYDHQGSYGEQAFLELINHIDRTYRTISDRAGRVVKGGSQGGRGAARYIFKHPDLFATAISVAAGHQWENHISHNNGVESQYLTIDDPKNNTWDLARAYASRNEAPKVNLMIVIGAEDGNYESNETYHHFLEELEIPHTFEVVTDQGHGVQIDEGDIGLKMLQFLKQSLKLQGIGDRGFL